VLADRPKLSVEDVFSLMAERLESYEPRPQQLELALAILSAFTGQEAGVFEAGTGTGKSLAALIPAVLSGKRVVVSSATIALQEQYIHKDIPALQALLPFDFSASIMKGRGNYIGLRRWEEYLQEAEIDERLVDWVHESPTGDVSELDFMPPMDVWLEVNSDSDDCLRNKCPYFADCFYFEAKRRADKADIIVVNHALLLADAAADGNILPAYDLLVIDEAHHFADIARDAFSASITNRGLRMLAARAAKRVNAPPQLVHDIEVEGNELFQRLNDRYPALKTRIREPVDDVQYLRASLSNLKKWLEAQEFENVLDVDMAREKLKLKARALVTTTNNYIQCLDLLAKPSEDWVVWSEKGDAFGSRFEVVAAPLDVAPFIQEFIFEKPGVQSVVCMSATLATNGEDPFAYFKHMVGAPGRVVQTRVASPFDYRRQSVLYLPDHLPDPNHPEYIDRASQEIERIVRLCHGRSFVLFTSYNAMNKAFEQVSANLPFECKRQGEMPRKRLLEWFRATPSAVLFGTASFWEGVSVEGEQLSCVIIDRIPFQVPDDPVYEAQCEALKERGERSWFTELALPHAIMRLKQGVGRLIRHRNDRGIVAILDPRLTRKQYGRSILECLPPMTMTRSLSGFETLEDLLATL
jgi:ATP-dependent DNA helicase DinG